MSKNLERNKIFAAVLLTGVIGMLAGFIGKELVEPEKLAKPVYLAAPVTPGPEASTATIPAGPEDILPLLASADAAAGQRLTQACAACHTFTKGGAHRVGPNLWEIVGAHKAHAKDYAYSDAMQKAGSTWSYDQLNKFLYSPRDSVPGTKMTYMGVKDTKNRANVIAYLRTLSDNPKPLPK